jgi:hypothetical protein
VRIDIESHIHYATAAEARKMPPFHLPPMSLPRPAPTPIALVICACCVVGIGACFGFSEAEAEPEPAAVRLHERLEELNRVRKRQLEVRAELGSIEGMAQGSSPAPRVAPNEAAEGTVGEPGAAEGGEARSFDSSLIRNGTQKLLEAVRRRVQHGPGATRGERLEELASIEQGLTPPEASSQLDALGRLYDFIGRDLHLGSSVRLEETPVELEDGARRVHAYVLGLGLVLEAFVSEDETLVGLRSCSQIRPLQTCRLAIG